MTVDSQPVVDVNVKAA